MILIFQLPSDNHHEHGAMEQHSAVNADEFRTWHADEKPFSFLLSVRVCSISRFGLRKTIDRSEETPCAAVGFSSIMFPDASTRIGKIPAKCDKVVSGHCFFL